ncbi:SRPBCC family protein [Litoribacter populi]|uniref:SRPBCC family protein n=1 Tax=Litoribacter populi TaxID=2598460 RepID=UPI00117CB916|nr:SRPBCC domain-containing protein [Litoribacter populi]
MPHIELLQYINAPREIVFEALTTQKGLSEVWTQKLKVKPQLNFLNEFDFEDGYATIMKVIEFEPDEKLIWHCVDSDPQWVDTTVEFNLSGEDGKTTVKLSHKHWGKTTDFYRWCNYNWGFFLYSLKQYCEEGEGIPFQKRKF